MSTATSRVDRTRFGIHACLNGLSHVVINVSDLDRSVEFYEKTMPVRRHCRIDGPAQPYAAFGVASGQMRGWVLRSLTAERGPGTIFAEKPPRDIHLVQWMNPTPVGAPYREANHVGIYRHNSLVGDIDAGYARVQAAGGRPYAEPSRILLTPDDFSVVCFGFRDPDGATLEMIGPDTPRPDYPGALHHCNINCTDLKRSYRFFRDVVGLDTGMYVAPGKPQPTGNGSLGDALGNPDGTPYTGDGMEFAANLLVPRNDWRNPIDLLEWSLPRPCGQAYASPFNLGISRIAFEVSDIVTAQQRLVAAGIGPVGAVEDWDMGEFGRRRVVIFRDPDGVWLELIEQTPPGATPLD